MNSFARVLLKFDLNPIKRPIKNSSISYKCEKIISTDVMRCVILQVLVLTTFKTKKKQGHTQVICTFQDVQCCLYIFSVMLEMIFTALSDRSSFISFFVVSVKIVLQDKSRVIWVEHNCPLARQNQHFINILLTQSAP